ncbi:glycosyltransferase family 4 protein [Kocuria rosea]|uniref:glycosyltransferase family 4 protein n=1 Tax=Kocuria rosea TaxID=1275 RepID=UPI003D324A5E
MTAPALEALFQLLMKADLKSRDVVLAQRNRRHRRKVASVVSNTNGLDAIIAQYHSGLEPFRAAAQCTTKILMYPIAHHSWMQETMRMEAENNPEWADFLQGYGMPRSRQTLLDTEIRLADKVMVPSSFVKSTFIDAGVDAEKVVVQNLGAELPAANMPLSDSEQYSPRGTIFLFAGQVNQRKGIGYVLEAFAQLKTKDTELLIAGHASASMRDRLSRYAGVTYLGTMPRQDLYAVMAKADALLLPSFAEGFPLTALEAMANRCVPIVSQYTFASDVIRDGENGFVVDAGSVEQLVQRMTDVMDNRGRTRAIKLDAQRTAREYSWAAYERNSASAVHQLIRECAPGSCD